MLVGWDEPGYDATVISYASSRGRSIGISVLLSILLYVTSCMQCAVCIFQSTPLPLLLIQEILLVLYCMGGSKVPVAVYKSKTAVHALMPITVVRAYGICSNS